MAIAFPAEAQNRGAFSSQNDENPAIELDTIVVTTRRTEELLEEVPGSVVVLSEEEIRRSNIDSTNDVIFRLPNVSFVESATPGDLNLSIRGVSNLIGTSASGPTNGVFVDGILLNPTGGTTGINPNLFDLERVEAAFGPQGTAFGRGTIGGAINFVPRKPSEEFELSLSGEIGSFPDGEGRIVLNTPILEDGLLSARLVAFGGASDGFVEQTLLDNTIGRNDAGARLSLRSQPTDRLTIDISGSYDRTGFEGPNSITQDSLIAEDPEVLSDVEIDDSLERVLITGQGAYDFDFGTLISRTSFLRTDLESAGDGDLSSIDFSVNTSDTEERSIAQEFRFESEEFDLPGSVGTLLFNVGTSISFNSFESTTTIDPGQGAFDILSPVLGPGLGLPPGTILPDDGSTVTTDFEQEVFNFGVFGDVRWRPIEPLEIVVGARFNRDRVRAKGETVSTGLSAGFIPSSPLFVGENTFTDVTPSASIRYEWNDDFSTYFSFSTGFRAGGFSQTFAGLNTFDEERVRSYELGFRASLFDDRLLFNGSGYLLDYDDIQVATSQVVGGFPVFTIDNAASARSVGAELGLAVLPLEGLRLDGQLGLNYSKFTDFSTSPFGDLTGERLPNAPVTTFSFVADYQHPQDLLPGLQGFVRGEYNFTSEFSNLLDPNVLTFDSYSLLNFRLGVRGERMGFELFVENALDEVYATGSTSLVAAGVIGSAVNVDIGATRRFGARAFITF
ncbi:MAG: TonB-dependent receptor [Pseudomonadota bacterium]